MSSLDGGFDIAVVGGGWGGLATGALLSRRGFRVLLCEMRTVLGGRASFVEREGFTVDYGIHGHRFGGDGPAARVYRGLGEELYLLPPGQGGVYHRGKMYPSPDTPVDYARTGLLSRRDKLSLARSLARLVARKPESIYRRSVASMLHGGLTDNARFVLSTLTGLGLISPDLDRTSAGEFVWFLRRAARAPDAIAFPRGGCRQHVQRLSAAIEENGRIETDSVVREVMFENGRAIGIRGDSGTFRSRAVVLAIPLTGVPGLLPPGTLTPDLETGMRSIIPTAGLSWDVGLKRSVSDLGAVTSTDPLVIGAFSSNIDPDLCPEGKQLATWCLPLPVSMFNYREKLRRQEGVLRETVLGIFRGMEDAIEWERMIRMPVIDGAVPVVSQPWPVRPGPADSGVEGLFLAGDSVGVPGEGGDIAFESALRCAEAVTSELR